MLSIEEHYWFNVSFILLNLYVKAYSFSNMASENTYSALFSLVNRCTHDALYTFFFSVHINLPVHAPVNLEKSSPSMHVLTRDENC